MDKNTSISNLAHFQLLKAVEENDLVEVRTLIANNNNNDVFNTDACPSSAIGQAATIGNLDIAEVLASAGCDVNAADAETKMTPLMHAAANGNSNVVKLLLESGANVDDVDECNRSTMYWAVSNGKLDSVKLLLQHQATIRPKAPVKMNSEGNRMFDSIPGDSKETFIPRDLLYVSNPFLKACLNNNVQVVQQLLQHDASLVTSLNNGGENALHIAARSGCTDVLAVLLYYKSLLTQTNKIGETPLHVACHSLFTDVHQHVMDIENVGKCAELLIKSGVDVTIKDLNGHCALHALLMGSFSLKGPDSRLGRLRFRLVQLILSSAKSISQSDLPHPSELSSDLTEEHSDILQWLHSFLRTPRSMQHMCRVAVRQTIGPARLERIGELPCTPNLIRYVSLI